MNRRGFTSRFLKLGVFSSLSSKFPVLAGATGAQDSDKTTGAEYSVEAENLTIRLNANGDIAGASIGPQKLSRLVTGHTFLVDCVAVGPVKVHRLDGGGIEFTSSMAGPGNRSLNMTQRFVPGQGSVRWEIEITGDGDPWTTPITTRLLWPQPEVAQLWTSWMGGDDAWKDPLQPQPMSKCSWPCSWDYGPYATIGGFCIPLASVLEPKEDIGLSLVLSLEDPLFELSLTSDAEGEVSFSRADVRLGQGRTVKLAADLVAHEADWRGGLRWMVRRYEPFFEPPNPKVQEMSGTGAYSGWNGPLDVPRLKQMAYSVLWEAAFDWPYMGMYFPPVGRDQRWWTAGYDSGGEHILKLVKQVSYRELNDRAQKLDRDGFYYLNYLNLAVWGWRDVFNLKVINRNLPENCRWMDPVTYLQEKVADGIWRDDDGKESLLLEGTLVADPDGPDYQAEILAQARRVLENIPDSWGFAIDRTWWGVDYTVAGSRTVNYAADDGVGWYKGRPGRHIAVSFKETMAKLGPLMHGARKVIFYNPCISYRVDLMRDVDGFFGEGWPTHHGYTCVNGTGFLALQKPGIVWTYDGSSFGGDPDAYFQRHLHMGVYPMVPYMKNDHSITPDPETDAPYLDYGPLLAAMRGKKWVLEPHCIDVEGGKAKANLFAVPAGWAAPITFGPKHGTIQVTLRNLPGLGEGLRCEALLPGSAQPEVLRATFKNGELTVQTPLKRGCSMLRIAKAS